MLGQATPSQLPRYSLAESRRRAVAHWLSGILLPPAKKGVFGIPSLRGVIGIPGLGILHK